MKRFETVDLVLGCLAALLFGMILGIGLQYTGTPEPCVPWENGGTLCIEKNPHGDQEAIYTPPSSVVSR